MSVSHTVPFTLFSLLFLNFDLAVQTQTPAYLKEYQSKDLPLARTPEPVVAVRNIALGNAQLKKALGKNFSYLGSESLTTATERALTIASPIFTQSRPRCLRGQ